MTDEPRLALGRMQNPVRGLMHGSAAVCTLLGGTILWTRAAGDGPRQLAILVFVLSMAGLYTASSLYHSIPWQQRWKGRMQRVDHAMIYVLVAGTYTPIATVVLDGWLCWATLMAAWGIAAVGILQKIVRPHWNDGLSIALQTIQGWLGLVLVVPLARQLPWQALALMIAGGVLYTVGMVLFVNRRPRLWPRVFSYHEVFHVFVVAGSAAHYAMIHYYVVEFGLVA